MAELVSCKIKAHNNIYMFGSAGANGAQRELKVEIGIPEDGGNDNTGILVVVPGYGGDIDSNIFRKMRDIFPEQYNVAVVQCDYFGNQFMGNPAKVEIASEDIGVSGKVYRVDTGETIEEFNDMGIMQALDVVNATLYVIQYLRDKGLKIDRQRVMLFGNSHGAYVAHLANLICPGLYGYLIDISSYVVPYYLKEFRCQNKVYRDTGWHFAIEIETYLKRYPMLCYHEKLYDLRFLYKNAKNFCKIIAFQGTQDWMVDYREKQLFMEAIGQEAQLMLIQKEDIDGTFCKNADHGLGMDFLVLFEMLMPMLDKSMKAKCEPMCFQKVVTIGNETASIKIDYTSGMPELKYITFMK